MSKKKHDNNRITAKPNVDSIDKNIYERIGEEVFSEDIDLVSGDDILNDSPLVETATLKVKSDAKSKGKKFGKADQKGKKSDKRKSEEESNKKDSDEKRSDDEKSNEEDLEVKSSEENQCEEDFTDNLKEIDSDEKKSDKEKSDEKDSDEEDSDEEDSGEDVDDDNDEDDDDDEDDNYDDDDDDEIKKKKRKKKKKKHGPGPVKKKIQRLYEAKNYKWIVACFIIAFFEDGILEILGRRSFENAFKFMFNSPLVFFINILIIFGTLLLGLLFRKRLFFVFLGGFLWFVMGFINFMVLGFRITPFSAIDFLMAVDVMSMMDIYFNKLQQILIFMGIGVVIFLVVLFFRWTPKVKGKLKRLLNFSVCAGVFLLSYVLINIATEAGMISDDFSNLGNAYKEYGFVYCFSNSIIDVGVSKPSDYSDETVKEIFYETDKSYKEYLEKRGEKKTPNIIIVQLESFIDIDRIAGIHTDKDAVPNTNAYMEKYQSGYLTVPSIGAGTANVECEVLTGMKTGLFGAGEYPYKTVLTNTPCESLAQILKRQGYTTFAMHNNKAVFYSRNEVYNQLGFDYFDSQEFMEKLTYTSTGWAKDEYLVNEIEKCLDSTDSDDDFVHCISVQGHGKYPEDGYNCTRHITVTRDDGDPVLTNQYGYFVNQCYEMDAMLADLKKMLDDRGEDYVLFVYGDHLPSIPFEMEDVIKGNEFQTEYILINNMGIKFPKDDIATYEFSDYLLSALNLDKGIFQRIHSEYEWDSEIYTEALHTIQYDMLYGDRYIYMMMPQYSAAGMMMGLNPIYVNEVTLDSNQIVVKGSNFTEFSTVVLNDERLVTTYVDSNTIIVANDEFEEIKAGDRVVVEQIDKDKHKLGESVNAVIYNPGY